MGKCIMQDLGVYVEAIRKKDDLSVRQYTTSNCIGLGKMMIDAPSSTLNKCTKTNDGDYVKVVVPWNSASNVKVNLFAFIAAVAILSCS